VADIRRQTAISEARDDDCKKSRAGPGLRKAREPRQVRDENACPMRLMADLTLDRHVQQELVAKPGAPMPASRVPHTLCATTNVTMRP
jgi:hypothetical protein